jgi:hypothetical protein
MLVPLPDWARAWVWGRAWGRSWGSSLLARRGANSHPAIRAFGRYGSAKPKSIDGAVGVIVCAERALACSAVFHAHQLVPAVCTTT